MMLPRASVEAEVHALVGTYDWSLSPNPVAHAEVNARLASAWGFEDITLPVIPYARYDHALARLVAAKFVRRAGAHELGFQARLAGSGMGAIHTVAQAALSCSPRRVLGGHVLYGLTPDVLRQMEWRVDDHLKRLDTSKGPAHLVFAPRVADKGPVFIFVETVGNGIPMPELDVEAWFRKAWHRNVIFVLDNTFLTCALLNPFTIYAKLRDEMGAPRMQFVYVESLSKYYRCTPDSEPGTMGIVIASPEFIGRCDTHLVNGFAASIPTLRQFPFDLLGACEAIMPQLSANAAAAARFCRTHAAVANVWYPSQGSLYPQAGGVLFVELKDVDQRGQAGEVFQPEIPFRASFGHAHTTQIDFGAFDHTLPPGLVRIAVGTAETPEEVVDKLRICLG